MQKFTDDTPREIGGAIMFLRMFRQDQSFIDYELPRRSLLIASTMAVQFLREKDTEFYKAEVVGMKADCTFVGYTGLQYLTADAVPYYVRWIDDAGNQHEQRYIKKSDAYSEYIDLQNQDTLILTTNAHPYKKRG